jgi:hypothetical protein
MGDGAWLWLDEVSQPVQHTAISPKKIEKNKSIFKIVLLILSIQSKNRICIPFIN